MKRSIATVIMAATLTLGLSAKSGADESVKADLVVTGAEIYTVDGSRSWAHALAVKNGKFVWVGEESSASPFIGPSTKQISLRGEMILPGFHDSHVHPIDSGIELTQCRLEDANSKAEILSAIEKYVKAHPKEDWILGGGWSLPLFPNACPTKEDLDKLIPDRPAYFSSQDAHSAWVNSRALQLAHIDKSTKNPALGIIERAKNGDPVGTLRESATDLVHDLVPKPAAEERLQGLSRSLKMANRFGITSMQDANADEDSLKTYNQLGKQGRLSVKVVACLHVNPLKDASQVKDFVALRDKYTSEYVKPTSAKSLQTVLLKLIRLPSLSHILTDLIRRVC